MTSATKATSTTSTAPATKITPAARITPATSSPVIKATNPVATPDNQQKTSRKGRQDPYDVPSDSEADDLPKRQIKPLRRLYIPKRFPHSDPYIPAPISPDSEVVLLDKVSSRGTPSSRATPDSHHMSRARGSGQAKFQSGSIVISLDESSYEIPTSPSPSNPRPDPVGDSLHPRATPARKQPNVEVISIVSDSEDSDESASEEVSRELELPPTTKAVESAQTRERTKQYVLTGSSSPGMGIWSQAADMVLSTHATTPFFTTRGQSPLSAESQTTSTLIREQLMETSNVPPSNQELAAQMSSSPGKPSAGADDAFDWIKGRPNGGIEDHSQSSETLARMALKLLDSQDEERSRDTKITGKDSRPQTTRVLRSHSTSSPDQHVQNVDQVGTDDEENVVLPEKTQAKPAQELFDGSSVEPASKDVEDSPAAKSCIVVELPILTAKQQAQHYGTPTKESIDTVSPEQLTDTRLTAIPKSFQEINGATSTAGEQSQDSDAEALNYVLRRSPQWLNSITKLDAEREPETETEQNRDAATQAPALRPILQPRKSIPNSLARTSTTTDDSSCEENGSLESTPSPQVIPIAPVDKGGRKSSEDAAQLDRVSSPKEKPVQKQQQQGLQPTPGLKSGGVTNDVRSLSGEDGKWLRKSPLPDGVPLEKPSDRKRQKVSHSQGPQQHQDSPAQGKSRRHKPRRRNLGKKARAQRRQQQQQAQSQLLSGYQQFPFTFGAGTST